MKVWWESWGGISRTFFVSKPIHEQKTKFSLELVAGDGKGGKWAPVHRAGGKESEGKVKKKSIDRRRIR